MPKYPSRSTVAVWVVALALTHTAVLGCGRIGFELLPFKDVGPGPMDSGVDAAPVEASVDAAADTGTVDAGPTCSSGCNNDHGSADCTSGTCLLSCAIGYSDCDQDPGNGCEADIATLAETCGMCSTQCSNDHGSGTCSDGLCAPVCDSDYGDCDGNPDNGCETALTTTSACGACDTGCTNDHGSTGCVSQVCQPACDGGHADCDGNPDNGCETDILNDPTHCGSCPNGCAGNGICVDGTCEASPCAAGLGECDGDLTVTCETDLTSDADHCSFCQNACATLNGTPVCTNGACAVGACDPNYDDCDGDPADCEVDLTTNVDHCGACNAPCVNAHGNTRCENASCVPTCSSGWDDCDGNPDNGCETPLTTPGNCGMCGNVCPANGGTAVCTAGVCDTRCDLTGTFAVRMRVHATWSATSATEAGDGWFEWWARLDAVHGGDTADAQLRLCGSVIPPLKGKLVSDTAVLQYPDSLFDGDALDVMSSTLTLGDSSPDSSLSLPTVAFLVGLSMSDPLNDPWPSTASGIAAGNRVDMDADGHPGVTANFLNGGGYVYPRTSAQLVGFNRADREYIAARTSFSLNGALSSCTQSSGTSVFPHIQVRVMGCRRDSGGGCNQSEADFLDGASPAFVMDSGTYTMTKVADGAGCATVRTALP